MFHPPPSGLLIHHCATGPPCPWRCLRSTALAGHSDISRAPPSYPVLRPPAALRPFPPPPQSLATKFAPGLFPAAGQGKEMIPVLFTLPASHLFGPADVRALPRQGSSAAVSGVVASAAAAKARPTPHPDSAHHFHAAVVLRWRCDDVTAAAGRGQAAKGGKESPDGAGFESEVSANYLRRAGQIRDYSRAARHAVFSAASQSRELKWPFQPSGLGSLSYFS